MPWTSPRQGTKGLLFNEDGELVCRADRPHRQIISPLGWVSHDPEEIRRNTLAVCRDTVEKAGIDKGSIAAFGISNQRETTVAWDRETGKSICDAIVWQCARAEAVCERLSDMADTVRARTGLNLSPYFPAAKMGWIMENVPEAKKLADEGRLCLGTVDSWLLSFLTKEKVHATDYSNASRTQLFDIIALRWDEELCRAFGVPVEALPEVRMSDSVFGTTDLDGYLDKPIPICGVLGDSHGALFGQDCRRPGQVKATYGTGSSVMMNIGDEPRFSSGGLVTSLAWGMNGKVEYVFEGNLNYTGAVMTWLRKDVGLIENDVEATEPGKGGEPERQVLLCPRFLGPRRALLGQQGLRPAHGREPHNGPGRDRKGLPRVHSVSDNGPHGADASGRGRGARLPARGRGPDGQRISHAVPERHGPHLGGGAEPAGALRHGRSLCGRHLRRAL